MENIMKTEHLKPSKYKYTGIVIIFVLIVMLSLQIYHYIVNQIPKMDLEDSFLKDNAQAVQYNIQKNPSLLRLKSKKSGETLLHLASKSGKLNVAKVLISDGSDINALTLTGESPLEYSIVNCHRDITKLLIDHGAKCNIHFKNQLMFTPLHFAVQNGDSELVALLLSKGADPNLLDEQLNTSLHIAVHNNYSTIPKIITLLINHGVNVNAKDMLGFTPLFISLSLIDKEQYNEKQYKQTFDIIKILVNNGANINATDIFGNFLLDYAKTLKHHKELVDYLVQHGATGKGKFSIK